MSQNNVKIYFFFLGLMLCTICLVSFNKEETFNNMSQNTNQKNSNIITQKINQLIHNGYKKVNIFLDNNYAFYRLKDTTYMFNLSKEYLFSNNKASILSSELSAIKGFNKRSTYTINNTVNYTNVFLLNSDQCVLSGAMSAESGGLVNDENMDAMGNLYICIGIGVSVVFVGTDSQIYGSHGKPWLTGNNLKVTITDVSDENLLACYQAAADNIDPTNSWIFYPE